MSSVYRRELKSNLYSMTGTIFIAFSLVFLGIYSAYSSFTLMSSQLEYAIASAAFMSLLAVPVLTMRTFSEERNLKVDRLLYSLPLRTVDIVLGKFFALATVMAIPTAVLSVFPIISLFFVTEGTVNFAIIYGTVLCYYLLGCAVIAICMFLSSLTESQVISAILSIAAILLLYFMSTFASLVPTSTGISFFVVLVLCCVVAYIIYAATKSYVVAGISGAVLVVGAAVIYILKQELYSGLLTKVFNAFSIFDPIYNFCYGIFDITAIIYYASACLIFVFLTIQSVEKRRYN